ncbi:MAG: hypothetical protein GY799_21195 [Desulfobulbaceae bacterium]|nr:hypothetical protein [Desulfobulbaceae bacterium]
MIIGIDFDGTICTHTYPVIGRPVPHAVRVIKALQDKGHKLILWTVRGGLELEAAKDYCELQGIKFWGINENPTQIPGAKAGNNPGGTCEWSCKAHMNILIDDVALGCPMNNGSVDWLVVEQYFMQRGYL